MIPEFRTLSLADYHIVFDDYLYSLDGIIAKTGYSSVIILTDTNTLINCLPFLFEQSEYARNAKIITVPAGEAYKTLDTCQEIWAEMLSARADRKSLLINLGGGVIGDMGGFAAACYKRGIDFIQIPTTVLSQVDSSIGGKLGVDFKYGKNLIGVFKNPALVLISNQWLKTLPERQIINGYAEIFKHALIRDTAQWNHLKAYKQLPLSDLYDILQPSLEIKRTVVEADPFEKGLRKILNFGHTIGHAVEANSLENDASPLLHGEAVAVGMIMEAFISHHVCGLESSALDEITSVLMQHFPRYSIQPHLADALWLLMALDKKNEGKRILSVGLKDIGHAVWDVEITPDLLKAAVNYYTSLL
jgi:3-dehydroquinate synthase